MTAAETAETTSTAVLGSNVVVNLLMSASLNMLWSMINSLQIVTHVPLMDLRIPANMGHFLVVLIEIATFDFLSDEVMARVLPLP